MKTSSKSVVVSGLVLALGLTAAIPADAATTKPSELDFNVHNFSAVLKQDVKVYDSRTNKLMTLKKGMKTTVTKRVNVDGYDYLVLAGDRYMPISNTAIQFVKPLKSKRDYDAYRPSAALIKELARVQGKANYKKFKGEAIVFDQYYHSENVRLKEMQANSWFYKVNYGNVGIGWPTYLKYENWMKYGDKAIKHRMDFRNHCGDQPQSYINTISKEFYQDFFVSPSRTIKGVKAGMSQDSIMKMYKPCGFLGTSAGTVTRHQYIGVAYKGTKAKEILIVPAYGNVYKAVLDNYGKPSSVINVTQKRVEYIMVYDHVKKDGFKIMVALDKKGGNVKYMRKIND